jgi:hypothetical protein
MKKNTWILIIIGVLLIVAGIGIYFIPLETKALLGYCTFKSPQNCDNSCEIVDDCFISCGCGVINKDETCRTHPYLIDCKLGNPELLRCVDGQCVYGG